MNNNTSPTLDDKYVCNTPEQDTLSKSSTEMIPKPPVRDITAKSRVVFKVPNDSNKKSVRRQLFK